MPFRQSVIKNPIGERQCFKQVLFRGENCSTPTISRRIADNSTELLTIFADIKPVCCKSQWMKTAPALKITHITRYAPVNEIVLNFTRFWRFRPAKVKIIGAAEGSIMAIIINDHMMKTAIMFAADHTEVMGIISMARGFVMYNAAHARKTHPASDVNTSRLKVTDSVFTRLIKPNSRLFTLINKWCRHSGFSAYTKLNAIVINLQLVCSSNSSRVTW